MGELVLDALLHLGLNLGSLLLTFCDELGHAVVASDKNSNATFKQLSLDLLIGTLVSLSVELQS